MPRFRSLAPAWLALALANAAAGSLGCFAFGRGHRDIDRTPVVDTGAGASILYPGQTAPVASPGAPSEASTVSGAGAPPPQALPPTGRASPDPEAQVGSPPYAMQSGTSRAAPGGSAGSARASGSPSAGLPVTTIGGAQTDQTGHVQYREEPIWFKYVALPFALAAAPFKAAADAVRGEPEPGPEIPRHSPATPRAAPAPPSRSYESAQLDAMERELDRRQAQERSAGPGPSATSSPHVEPAGRPLSIADELASFQRSPTPPDPPPAPSPPTPGAGPSGTAVALHTPAHGIVDRDGDGQIDHWIYRERGEIVREIFDENGDGRPDRTFHYDLATHQVSRVEEDTNHDGVSDSWTDYRNGALVRRRTDANGDGAVDGWSYFRDGHLTRLERDTTGDGFRDRVSFYHRGRLAREERDHDADGQPDATVHYDENERVSRHEEDTDGDGHIDVISYYDEGRLIRRELIDASLLERDAPAPERP